MDTSYSFIPQGVRGRVLVVIIVLLMISLMYGSSRNYLHYDSFSCYGLLGAGFPASFLCDYSEGGAPVFGSNPESAERIDRADFPYFSLQGVVVDLSFYAVLILLTWFMLTYGIHHLRRKRRVDEA